MIALIVTRFATAMPAPAATENAVPTPKRKRAMTAIATPITPAAMTEIFAVSGPSSAASALRVVAIGLLLVLVLHLRCPGILAALETLVVLDVTLHALRGLEERAKAGVTAEQEAYECDPVRSSLLVEPDAQVVADRDRAEQLEAEPPIPPDRFHSLHGTE